MTEEELNKQITNEWYDLTLLIKGRLEKELDPVPYNIDQISGRLSSVLLDDRLMVEARVRAECEATQKPDSALIRSLQLQVEDLRKHAREYARKDLLAELRDGVDKEKDAETHQKDCEYQREGCDCGFMERLSYNKGVDKALEILTNFEIK